MGSGGWDEGYCRICGGYTKGVDYHHSGLCMGCANRQKAALQKVDMLWKAVQHDYRVFDRLQQIAAEIKDDHSFDFVVDDHFWDLFDTWN